MGMKNFLALLMFCFFLSNSANGVTCIERKNIHLSKLLYENDVFFIGRKTPDQGQDGLVRFSIVEPLKGSFPKDTVEVKPYGHPIFIERDSNMSLLNFGYYKDKNLFLVFGNFNRDQILTEELYSACTSIPGPKKILSFFKGPYLYQFRYFILAFFVFFVYVIWRVGGVKNFATVDIFNLPRIVFSLHAPVKTHPMRFKKTGLTILFLLVFLFFLTTLLGDRFLSSLLRRFLI